MKVKHLLFNSMWLWHAYTFDQSGKASKIAKCLTILVQCHISINLKTSENQRFSDVFRGIEIWHRTKMGQD